MSSQPQTYNFTNVAVAPRSRRISEAVWEKHRVQICDLYTRMPLDKVGEVMVLQHNFHATSSQYYSRIHGKWKISKHRRCLATRPDPDGIPQADSRNDFSCLKRPRIPDNGDDEGVTENLEHPTKKVSNEASGVLPVACGQSFSVPPEDNDSAQFKPPATGECNPSTTWTSLDSALEEMATLSDSSNHPTSHVTLTHRAPAAHQTEINKNHHDEKDTQQNRSLACTAQSRASQNLGSGRDSPDANVKKVVRSVNIREPVEELSAKDLAGIREAADYFAALHRDSEAFELYMFLLDRELSSPHPSSSVWALITRCVHATTGQEHAQIIRSRLESMDERIDSLYSHQALLSILKSLLMIKIFTELEDSQAVRENIQRATRIQLDLKMSNNTWTKADRNLFGQCSDLAMCKLIDGFDIHQLELHTIYSLNIDSWQRIKLCLTWLTGELVDFESITEQLAEDNRFIPVVYSGYHSKVLLSCSLYRSLWGRVCAQREQGESWMLDSQEATGISSSEILIWVLENLILCDEDFDRFGSILSASPPEDWLQVVMALRGKACKLVSDWDKGRTIYFPIHSYRQYFLGYDPAVLLADIEKSLGLRIEGFAELGGDMLWWPRNDVHLDSPTVESFEFPSVYTQMRLKAGIYGDTFWNSPRLQDVTNRQPTLAPSLGSSDFSSFRRGARATDHKVRAFRRNPPSILSFSGAESAIDSITDSFQSRQKAG